MALNVWNIESVLILEQLDAEKLVGLVRGWTMEKPTIIEKKSAQIDSCNLPYLKITSSFDWQRVLQSMTTTDGSLNICHQALDQHLPQDATRTALRFIGIDWPQDINSVKNISYAELTELTRRFANGLRSLGVQKDDVVFALAPRIPELYTVVLGTLRLGAVFSPLFSAFGPEPISARMSKGNARAIFSLASLYRKKIAPIRESITSLQHIILIDDDGSLNTIPGAIDFHHLMDTASTNSLLAHTVAEDHALMHFTSGTTGKPKGAMHVHAAVAYHKYSGQFALDLKPNDIFWCTADPGWVTGISYGIISPLVNGCTLLIDAADFQAKR